MSDGEANLRALEMEWWAARIVGGLGLVALIAAIVLLILGYGVRQLPAPDATAPLSSESSEAPPEQSDLHAQGRALCTAALGSAVNFGILPNYTKLTGEDPQTTDVRGRYVCRAATDAAKYTLTFDLTCATLNKAMQR